MQIPSVVWDNTVPMQLEVWINASPAEMLAMARELPWLGALSALWLWLGWTAVAVAGDAALGGLWFVGKMAKRFGRALGRTGLLLAASLGALLVGFATVLLPAACVLVGVHLAGAPWDEVMAPAQSPAVWTVVIAVVMAAFVSVGLAVGGILLVMPLAVSPPTRASSSGFALWPALALLGRLTRQHVWLLGTTLLLCQLAQFAADVAGYIVASVSNPLGQAAGLMLTAVAAPLGPLCGVVILRAATQVDETGEAALP